MTTRRVDSRSCDVAVVGAGSAGAAAAAFLAELGLSVVLIERRRLGAAGAHWVNGIPAWAFERAGVDAPEPPESVASASAEHGVVVSTPRGEARIRIDESPMTEVDMRLLVGRLQSRAIRAGARVLEGRVDGVELQGPRITAVTVLPPDGASPLTVRARLFVDASGIAGALRSRVPWMAARCRAVDALDTCSAAQHVYEVTDPEAAAAFLRSYGAAPGDAVALVGVAGGYSVLTVLVTREADRAGVLTGSIPATGQPGGPTVLARFVDDQPWLGRRLFGGQAAIPLRRPYTWLAGPGLALVGDAACQVYGAHGSGVGMGLIAARMLADAVGSAADPGDPVALHAGYTTRFQRTYGGLLAGADVFRRLSQRLSADDVGTLIDSGLLTPSMALSGLSQRPPELSLDLVVGAVRGALRSPRLAARLVPALVRIAAVERLYSVFPSALDERSLARFGRHVRRVTGISG